MTRLTKTTTFRIDENHNKELKIIANENQISTNTLVNQIIGNYVTIAGKSGVTKNIKDKSIVAGFPAIDIKKWKKNIINLNKINK